MPDFVLRKVRFIPHRVLHNAQRYLCDRFFCVGPGLSNRRNCVLWTPNFIPFIVAGALREASKRQLSISKTISTAGGFELLHRIFAVFMMLFLAALCDKALSLRIRLRLTHWLPASNSMMAAFPRALGRPNKRHGQSERAFVGCLHRSRAPDARLQS